MILSKTFLLSRLVITLLVIHASCVDRLEFDKSDFDNDVDQIVIDGSINDGPGPYTVRVFKSSNADDILNFREGINAKRVSIVDDLGSEAVLLGKQGFYFSDPSNLRGEIGREYHVKVELFDGRIFESIPEKLKPAGKIDSLYAVFESFKPLSGPTRYGYRIYVDASTEGEAGNFIRWKYTGVYLASSSEGTCWAYLFEDKPIVSNNSFVSNGKFQSIEVGYVPVEQWTFFKKFMIRVDQMSLTKNSFDFWRTVQSQIDGSTSLFQPSFGKPPTNIRETTGNGPANGIFYATSIDTKILFLERGDVPVPVDSPVIIPEGRCSIIFVNATDIKPVGWID